MKQSMPEHQMIRRLLRRPFWVGLGLGFVSCSSSAPVLAASEDGESLIPFSVTQMLKRMAPFKRNPQVQFPSIDQVKQIAMVYRFEASDGTKFWVNFLSAEPHIIYQPEVITQAQQELWKQHSLSEAVLRDKAKALIDRFFPQPETFNAMTLVPPQVGDRGIHNEPLDYSGEIEWDFTQHLANGILGPNRCDITLRRDTGAILECFVMYHQLTTSLQPAYSREEALALARWAASGGKPIKLRIQLLSEFTPAERQLWHGLKGLGHGHEDVKLEIDVDPWLHQRLVWTFEFNTGLIELDAQTGQVLQTEPSMELLEWRNGGQELFQPFMLSKPMTIPAPHKMPLPPTVVETATVNFNTGELRPDDTSSGLHYPPIIINNSALICADYFPAFLISVTAKGDAITLQGQLKDKGKLATLKIGGKQATVDGKAVELTEAPVTIDGRLYLPAELLQQVNGIPIRWEPKKKLLWVETRYLRRD